MTPDDSSIDAIWAEMQRPTSSVTRLLNKSMATTSKNKTNRTKKRLEDKTTADIAHLTLATCSSNSHCTPVAERHVESFSLAKELNRLTDAHSSVRKQAAVALEHHFLINPNNQENEECFHEIAKPLFKKFNDSVEKVRDVCIRITTKYISTELDLLRILPYLMPAIANRWKSQWNYDEENQVFTRDQFLHDAFKRGRVFVSQEQAMRIQPSEPSEEIRLLFLQLLDALLNNTFTSQSSSILHAYIFDILIILVSAVHDDYHEINIQACRILQAISNHMVSVMKHFTVAFIRTTSPLLNHRLARVRVASIECIRVLVSCPNYEKCKGSGTEAIVDLIGHRDENVIPISAFYAGEVRVNYFARLGQDSNPIIRTAFYDMVQDWITTLPDRYDHESRLMPYVLAAVSDELDTISNKAMVTVETLGRQYERDHGEEVLEMKQYGVDGKNPMYNYTAPLPSPFSSRPSLGARLYVRGRTRRFLTPILRELENWQSPTRMHAVRLLKCVIIYSEETITVDTHVLLNTLLRVWDRDAMQETMPHLRDVAELVGRFVAPQTYVPLMLARIRGDDDVLSGSMVTPATIATALDVLSELMRGSLDTAFLPVVTDVVDVLTKRSLLVFETPRLRKSIINVAMQVLSLFQRRGNDAISAYFLAHGRLMSLERLYNGLFELVIVLERSEVAAEIASKALLILAEIQGCATTTILYDVHVIQSLERAALALQGLSDVEWSPKHVDQVILEQLVHHASLSKLIELKSTLIALIMSTLQSKVYDEINKVVESESSTIELTGSSPRVAVMKQLIDELIVMAQSAKDEEFVAQLQSIAITPVSAPPIAHVIAA